MKTRMKIQDRKVVCLNPTTISITAKLLKWIIKLVILMCFCTGAGFSQTSEKTTFPLAQPVDPGAVVNVEILFQPGSGSPAPGVDARISSDGQSLQIHVWTEGDLAPDTPIASVLVFESGTVFGQEIMVQTDGEGSVIFIDLSDF